MSVGLTPEVISNLNQALVSGMTEVGRRLASHAVNREYAVNRLLAVAPDPAAIEDLTALAMRCDRDRLQALGALSETTATAEQIRAFALAVSTFPRSEGRES